MDIRQFLILSTAHVSPETGKMLDETEPKDWPVCGGPWTTYGWFMWCHEEDLEGNIPPELTMVFDYARSKGCNYVLFDRDGDQNDDLPQFDW